MISLCYVYTHTHPFFPLSDALEGTSSEADANLSRDRWLEEVDYRQAVTRHLALWKERGGDLKKMTSRILEMEFECHESLKAILLDFLPKRHRLFVGIRDLMDPAVDALETYNLLAEMDKIDQRLEEAVVQFQPGKKRSILSLVSSTATPSEKNTVVPGLDNFASLTTMSMDDLKRNETVHDYQFLACKLDQEWETALVVVSRQHCLHIYPVADDVEAIQADETLEARVIQTALASRSPVQSVALIACDAEQTDQHIKIVPRTKPTNKDVKEQEEREETAKQWSVELCFADADQATTWIMGMQAAPEDSDEEESEEDEPEVAEAEVVRV